MSEFLLDLRDDPIPRLMKDGVWTFWDHYVTPTPAERALHRVWELAMEATFRIDPSVLFYVEALEPALTSPPTRWLEWTRDEKGWPNGFRVAE